MSNSVLIMMLLFLIIPFTKNLIFSIFTVRIALYITTISRIIFPLYALFNYEWFSNDFNLCFAYALVYIYIEKLICYYKN
jgi:hypothetical protein